MKITQYDTIEELLAEVEGEITLCESEEAALADIKADNEALVTSLDSASGVDRRCRPSRHTHVWRCGKRFCRVTHTHYVCS